MDSDGLGSAGYLFLRGAKFGEPADESKVPEFKEGFVSKLQELEVLLGKYPGPFAMGQNLSIVDVCYAPVLERFGANLPVFRGFSMRRNPDFPNVARWYAAMDALPAYRAVKSDDATHNTVVERLFGLPRPAGAVPEASLTTPEVLRQGSLEAGAKLVANHEAVVADVLKNAGLLEDADPQTELRVIVAVDAELRRLAQYLLTGAGGPPQSETGAATLAFVRDRLSSPRDMSAAAAEAFRAGADALRA
mmetsp:Transcript_97278/g.167664  ORF Transcript_97278/g.167664 Transcript_97278/m.167664 type:complete len:248 (-) Transcript_97278:320-1063(-)